MMVKLYPEFNIHTPLLVCSGFLLWYDEVCTSILKLFYNFVFSCEGHGVRVGLCTDLHKSSHPGARVSNISCDDEFGLQFYGSLQSWVCLLMSLRCCEGQIVC